ncbi:DUF3772 domain-containing protein [Pseudooceanicola sp. 216_PA32_1]|uniref:DUF3772 domain-containing protein n=1 Tax=Pseudooceanicola pacificus TaxID=2676438 RepID=A0A844W1S3_9RHOB|nr:DUF3772 domain-containing protein [Pseudooceanicola pacificus]MWB77045.1 DUF3772 domain-containing protein [Pseudooceanicola pacificus]
MRLFRLLTVLLLGLALLGPVATAPLLAQPVQGQPLDYEAWNRVAARAQEATDSRRASTEALEQLRTELVAWRSSFEAARSTNASAIDTVRAQLAALGPAPADDQPPEAADIATQRSELTQRLTELEAPGRAAEVAHSQADALIRVIDRIVRNRQTDELLELGPSPLNPVNWPVALGAAMDYLTALVTETRNTVTNPTRVAEAKAKALLVLILLAIATVLLLRGRLWTERLTQSVQDRSRTAERYLLAFLISLGQIILPVAGTIALVTAAFVTTMVSGRSEVVLTALPGAALAFFVARWVGGRIFPRSEVIEPPLDLTGQQRLEGRLHATFLGLVLFLYGMINAVGESENWLPGTRNVLLFPLMVLGGLMLLRVARLLALHSRAAEADGDEMPFRNRMTYLLSRAIATVAILGPAISAVGYFKLGYSIVFPTIFSLQTLGFLLILQRVVTEFYVLLTRNREGARDALAPVLAGFVLVIASVPIFALIWGARVTDLTELWGRFLAGFTVGETTVSPTDFLTVVVVFAFGFGVTRLVQGTLRTTVLPRTRIDPGGQTAIISGLGYVGIFLAAIVAITSAGINLSALGYVAGALSVGIGFGLQNIVSNFVSGIILLVERPVSEGDWIEVGPNMGFVRAISVRSTRIETFDRRDVIVPNADLVAGTVTNWTRGNLTGRLVVPIGVAYSTDTRHAAKVLQAIVEEQPMVLLNPPPQVVFVGFGADSLDFEIRAILRDILSIVSVQNEVRHRIIERFREEGIEIPFAQRDLWLRNPEALRGAGGTEPQTAPAATPAATEPATPLAPGAAYLKDSDVDSDGTADGGDPDGSR